MKIISKGGPLKVIFLQTFQKYQKTDYNYIRFLHFVLGIQRQTLHVFRELEMVKFYQI